MQKVIFFDLDGTLTPQNTHSTWGMLNLHKLGITPEEDENLFGQYRKGTLNYHDWTAELMQLYKEHTPVTKDEVIDFFNAIELNTGAMEVIASAKEKGYRTVVISGSVDVIVETIAKRIHADAWLSCSKAVFDENNRLINITSMGDEAPAKLQLAQEYAKANGFELHNAIAVDDGGNGVELFKKVKGVLLGSNEKLKPLAWKQVQNLSEIPALL